MKFGPVPVAEAEGAILAHSIRLPGGRLRKGIWLDRSHLGQLAEAGHDTVVVARLDPGDMHEDEAARAVADALRDGCDALRASEPFTGRVNLIADWPGVVRINADAIHAANMIDPALTVATVAHFHQIHPGGMVATVKVIPYAVSKNAVSEASATLRGALSVLPPVHGSASLIITETPGGPGSKGETAIRDRLQGLGMALAETVTCVHETEALAACITKAQGDIVLVLTGSATSDEGDTAPAALRQAGGELERFGMPVDPGNLLFLGRLGDKPVIGLPGSARSPVLHGADWILSRVACGVEVTGQDIARMGVGGLLKEIPTRPQPRRGRSVGG